MQIAEDHFVVLWSKGAAACSLIHQGGRVRGGMREDWSQESTDRTTSSEFENPLHQLAVARNELLAKFQSVLPKKRISSSVEPAGVDEPEVDPVLSVIAEQSGMGESATRLAAFEHCTRGIVIFTAPIDKLKIEHISESKEFVVIPLDQAVTRTIFHLPNLLRVIDFETSFFTPDEVSLVADTLAEEAKEHAGDRVSYPPAAPAKRSRRPTAPKGIGKWIAIAVAVAIGVALFTFFSGDDTVTSPDPGPDTSQVIPTPKPKTESSIILVLPSETQVIISTAKFETRSDLLQAYGAGQATRLLPQKEQVIYYDSTEFAKGVYGYFKVEGSWRQGKLLQTLRSRDTVMIENFLPPLP